METPLQLILSPVRPPTFDDIVIRDNLVSWFSSAVKHVEKLHDLIREQLRWFPHKQAFGVAEKNADVISDLESQRTIFKEVAPNSWLIWRFRRWISLNLEIEIAESTDDVISGVWRPVAANFAFSSLTHCRNIMCVSKNEYKHQRY